MYTRQDYLNKTCTHDQYYGQFVDESVKRIVLSIGKNKLAEAYAKDNSFNSIPLRRWDALGTFINSHELHKRVKECNDVVSMSTLVCVLKVAARQIVTEESL